jgi:hypothetical protein
MVIDALYALQMTGQNELSMPQAVEALIRGLYEIEGTNLRMYYTANEAPGIRNITGYSSDNRLGYAGQRVIIYTLGPPLACLCALWIVSLVIATQTGFRYRGSFDPTNSTSIILGSALAAKNGRLDRLVVYGDGSFGDDFVRRAALGMDIKFEEGQGLVNMEAGTRKRIMTGL